MTSEVLIMKKRIGFIVPLALLICIMLIGTLAGCGMIQPPSSDTQTQVSASPTVTTTPTGTVAPSPTQSIKPSQSGNGSLEVTVVDVGHGDCIYIKSPSGKVMLIDAGESTAWDQVHSFLDSRNVMRIDVLIASHPHSDHIGSMDSVIKHYDIGDVYMPDKSNNTDDFKNFMKAMQKKDLKATTAKSGMKIDLDPQLKCEILAPIGTGYKDLNDYSVVLKITYGKTSFLLTADASKESEAEMVKKYGAQLKVDVLKAGHHGNESSSNPAFLKLVKPKYVAISEKDINEYADPQARLDSYKKFTDLGATVFRTDASGDITFFSDGTTISVKTAK